MERAMAAREAQKREQQQNKGPRPPRTGGSSGSAFRNKDKDQYRKK